LLYRRIIVIALVAWLSLLVLSTLAGHLLDGTVKPIAPLRFD